MKNLAVTDNEERTQFYWTEDQVRFLYWLLADERLRTLDERRFAHAANVSLTSYQQLTQFIRIMRDDLRQAADSEGWDLGSPEYVNCPDPMAHHPRNDDGTAR